VIVVAADLVIEQQAAERFPAVQAVVDRTRDATAVGHQLALPLQPGVQVIPVQLDLALSDGKLLLGAAVAYFPLDPEDRWWHRWPT
jgi:hypothetical protein